MKIQFAKSAIFDVIKLGFDIKDSTVNVAIKGVHDCFKFTENNDCKIFRDDNEFNLQIDIHQATYNLNNDVTTVWFEYECDDDEIIKFLDEKPKHELLLEKIKQLGSDPITFTDVTSLQQWLESHVEPDGLHDLWSNLMTPETFQQYVLGEIWTDEKRQQPTLSVKGFSTEIPVTLKHNGSGGMSFKATGHLIPFKKHLENFDFNDGVVMVYKCESGHKHEFKAYGVSSAKKAFDEFAKVMGKLKQPANQQTLSFRNLPDNQQTILLIDKLIDDGFDVKLQVTNGGFGIHATKDK